MAKLFNIAFAGQYPPMTNRINHFDRLLAQKVGDSGVITTATGNPVSIVTNKAQNAISTILSYSPKQSGSGDPSPQNIRPIEGWTEAVLHVNEDTITANLGGTYYGFSVDLENGTLTVTHTAETYDGTEEGWTELSGSRGYYLPIDGSGYSRVELLKSSFLIGTNAGSSASMPLNSIMLNSAKINLLCRVDTETDFPTLDSWKAFLAQNNLTVVYPLAKPQTITLTPQTVALLAGNNTLWTDGDEISITYKAKR